ncbi:MAG: hypothetical protein II889_07275 [Clostridia bacterium]|nr:hypothetical protein [Clostridia bacterium]
MKLKPRRALRVLWPLASALCLCLGLWSCRALDSFMEEHETAVYIPVETQVTDPLFSWEEEEAEPAETEEPAEPDVPEELPFDPVPSAEIPSPSPGEVEVKPPEEQEETEAPETEAPEAKTREIGSTPWTSLTPGEDEPRAGLFTRAETALVTEQIVRCAVNRLWLDPAMLDVRSFDADSVSNFYFSSLKYADAEDYPEALRGIIVWNEAEAKYAVTERGADIAKRFFKGGSGASTGDDRYTVDEDGYPVSKYDLEDLEILSDEISTTARFRLISYENKEPEDCGEYRLFFYKNEQGDDPNPIPCMKFAKKGEPEDEDAPALPLGEWVYEDPIPDFLNEEQADLWRDALMLEGLNSDPASFLESFPKKDGEPFLSGEYYPTYSTVDENATAWDWVMVRGRFENYYDFERAVTAVYEWNTWQKMKTRFKNFDGKLGVANGAMGSRVGHMPDHDRFEIIESNEWALDFWYIAAYEHELGMEGGPIDYERWHVTYVNTDDGWRLTEFASGRWGSTAEAEDCITAHRVTDDGARLLTEQIVRYVMPAEWREGEITFQNDDALRFLYSLTLFADAEEHPFAPYVRLMEDRERYEIAEEDARMIAREVFGIDDLAIPDGAFDEVAGCVWIPVGIELPATGYGCEDFHISSDGESRTAMFYLAEADGTGLLGTCLFTYAPGLFGKPLFSVERMG